jgi:hypothetical protein
LRPERAVLPIPLPDFATNRGFAVRSVGPLVCPAEATFAPGPGLGVETADFAKKFFVTETDLNDAGFFNEFDRKCPVARSFVGSTLPGRLISVSEPPLAATSSDADCSPESPFASSSFVSVAVAGAG